MIFRLAAAVALLLSGTAYAEGPTPALVSACFSPGPVHCADVIADAIDAAQATIRIQTYWFLSAAELRALTAAKERGVDVQVIVKGLPDMRPATGFGAAPIAREGIIVWVDAAPISTDTKLLVLDASTVITSGMRTRPALNNSNPMVPLLETMENVVIIRSAEVAGWYERSWTERQAVSKALGAE